jgi:hypothetical protein
VGAACSCPLHSPAALPRQSIRATTGCLCVHQGEGPTKGRKAWLAQRTTPA